MPTSEERNGIPEQPGPLCYHIDFGVHPALVSGDIPRAEIGLNMLRAEIIKLREWGEAWKRLAISRQPQSQIDEAKRSAADEVSAAS